jgi:hypothetical protein
LCKKEFFNEDYLKLHRINKHGLKDDDHKKPFSSSSSTSSLSSNKKDIIDIIDENSNTANNGDNSNSQLLLNAGFNLQQAAAHFDLFGNNPAAAAAAAAAAAGITNPAIFGIMDSYFAAKMADRVTCDICNKQVCNKYFLKTHKLKVHGCVDSQNAGDDMDENSMQQAQQFAAAALSSTSSPPPQSIDDDEQNDEMRMFKMNKTNLQQSPNRVLNGSSSKSTSSLSSVKPVVVVTPSKPRPPALARVICHICKKELCNKYFLRSHLQNAHNITVDEGFMPSSQNTINDNGSDLERRDRRGGKCDNGSSRYNDGDNNSDNMNNTTLDNSDNDENEIDIDSKHEQVTAISEYEEQMSKLQTTLNKTALFNYSLLNSNLPFLNPPNSAATSAGSNMQPFLIEGHDDDLFQTNFVPCMVYLPVKSKLSSSVSIKITLKPLIDDDNNINMQSLVKTEPIKE